MKATLYTSFSMTAKFNKHYLCKPVPNITFNLFSK